MAIVKRIDPSTLNLKEQVVSINRVTKVVKGGKNLSFSALVVIGDPSAKVVGYGVGKAKEVPSAIRKGIEAAKKNLRKVHVPETTIPHQVLGAYASSQVLLKPAPEGTGVIAGGAVRAVISACGAIHPARLRPARAEVMLPADSHPSRLCNARVKVGWVGYTGRLAMALPEAELWWQFRAARRSWGHSGQGPTALGGGPFGNGWVSLGGRSLLVAVVALAGVAMSVFPLARAWQGLPAG